MLFRCAAAGESVGLVAKDKLRPDTLGHARHVVGFLGDLNETLLAVALNVLSSETRDAERCRPAGPCPRQNAL